MEIGLVDHIVSALGKTFASSSIEISPEIILQWVTNAEENIPGEISLEPDQLEKIINQTMMGKCTPMGPEVSRRNLARWFEIPEEEFVRTPVTQLEPEVLIRHIYLEKIFSDWFEEWGYHVETGTDLEGIEDIEFLPDVYARIETVHGDFEVVVCLICDDPPSVDRARAKFETFESFARSGSPFGARDVFIMATPFKFGRSIRSSISVQNMEEDYTVIEVEGDDIWRLYNARDPRARLQDLKEMVQRAQEVSDEYKKINLKEK